MSLTKKAIGGSIHRIREFELEKVNLVDEFDILQIVGEGWFGKILLTEHRSTQTEMVLKALPKAYTGVSDFFREFHYGLHLAAHRNIITTYDVAFETAGFYVFSQEYAPLGDLTSNVTETGLGELHAKRVARQLAAAVHHIHSRELVHRDIKLDNVLVFRSDFSRIKLCDFGETRRVNTVVRRHNEWLPYSPPEVLQIDTDETYKALTSHDVWQFGIVLFVCLTGCLPWQKAALDDPRYTRYQNWHNATLNIAKKPKLFQLISSRAQRMFKRLLDPRAEKRPASVLEVNKYLEDRWLAKLGAEKALYGGADERDELCPSMYSFHSSVEEKNQLLYTLTTYGIETTVDRSRKKDRIREWIQSSAIVEENEDEEGDEEEGNVAREVDLRADEDEEPHTMRGRHFPERRPSSKPETARPETATKRHGKHSTRSPASAKTVSTPATATRARRQSAKPVERKIPFAPQVAEERETVARFASFPNGDPSLAIAKNASNGAADARNFNGSGAVLSRVDSSALDDPTSAVHRGANPVATSVAISSANSHDVSQNESSAPVPNSFSNSFSNSPPNSRVASETRVLLPSAEDARNGRSAPRSPQVPARKHRAQTAPFPTAASPRADATRAPRMESSRRSQSAATLSSPRPENRVDASSGTPGRANNHRPDARNENASGGSSADNAIASGASSNGKTERRSGASPMAANSLTMSVASQLVMQSFTALQGLNNAVLSASASPTPSSTPRNATPPSARGAQRADEVTFAYGKDAYEHYGVAQGVVFRMEPPGRHGSTGSGSRSVSN